MWVVQAVFVLGCLSAASAHNLAPEEVIAPLSYSSDLEKKCLMRYSSTVSKMTNKECFKRCMDGEGTTKDCIELNVGAFAPTVVFPCHSHYVPYFDEKPLAKMEEGKEIVRLNVRSPTECQAECQDHKGCSWYLYYNPLPAGHSKNCELLLNFRSPLFPKKLWNHRGRRFRTQDYAVVINRHQCIHCDGVPRDDQQDTCARFHPYMVTGKPFCVVKESMFGRRVETGPPKQCRVFTAWREVEYSDEDWDAGETENPKDLDERVSSKSTTEEPKQTPKPTEPTPKPTLKPTPKPTPEPEPTTEKEVESEVVETTEMEHKELLKTKKIKAALKTKKIKAALKTIDIKPPTEAPDAKEDDKDDSYDNEGEVHHNGGEDEHNDHSADDVSIHEGGDKDNEGGHKMHKHRRYRRRHGRCGGRCHRLGCRRGCGPRVRIEIN